MIELFEMLEQRAEEAMKEAYENGYDYDAPDRTEEIEE